MPRGKGIRDFIVRESQSKLKLLALSYLAFATISMVNDLSILCENVSANSDWANALTRLISDLCRMSYYGILYTFGGRSTGFQMYGTYVFPIFFSVAISETYIRSGSPAFILER